MTNKNLNKLTGIKFFLLLVLTISCAENKNILEIKEFHHVKEIYNGNISGYSYEYYEDPLDSSEINELSKILDRKNKLYFISNKNKLYTPADDPDIGHDFLISRELVDTLVNKKAIFSPAVVDILQRIGKL